MTREEIITKFVLEPKPEWCRTLDVAIMVYLLYTSNMDWHASPSQETMANAVGAGAVNLAGLRRSVKRLVENGWLFQYKDEEKSFARKIHYRVKIDKLFAPRKEEEQEPVGRNP